MRKIISIVLSVGLLFQQGGLVYAAGEINLASYLSQARNVIVQPDVFQPARLRYISYDIANNDFKLLLDKGNAKLNDATPELFNYFLIGLALPNDTFWVNLRPDAPENIIDPLLEKTGIGKIFLEADLQLKKDTASLTSPQNPEGKLYWDKLYKKAGELFGTENITIPTITRPWIVPNEVIVRETEDSAYIYKATLKVMLESDYLIGRGGSRTAPTSDQYAFSDPRLKELNEYSSQIIRETIIPKLTKEVNSSKRYAQLRQVYYSLVLSRWFKQKYSSLGSTRAQGTSTPANSYLSLIDSGNLANLVSSEPCDKQTYFQAYQKSFKDGEYNLKETVPTPFGQSIRSYISGGISVVKKPLMSGNFIKPETVGSPVSNIIKKSLSWFWGKAEESENPQKHYFATPLLYDQMTSKVKTINLRWYNYLSANLHLLGDYPLSASRKIKMMIFSQYMDMIIESMNIGLDKLNAWSKMPGLEGFIEDNEHNLYDSDYKSTMQILQKLYNDFQELKLPDSLRELDIKIKIIEQACQWYKYIISTAQEWDLKNGGSVANNIIPEISIVLKEMWNSFIVYQRKAIVEDYSKILSEVLLKHITDKEEIRRAASEFSDVLKELKTLQKEISRVGSPLTLGEAKGRADNILFNIVRVDEGAASLLREEDSNVREAFEESNILDKIGKYYNTNTGEVEELRVLSEALESIRRSIDSFLRDKRVNGIKEKTAYIMMNKAGKDLGGLIKDIDDEILRRLLLPPEFITARDEISRELQDVINSLEDSINPIKVKAEYRSRYFSFVTEAIEEIKGIQEGFEYTKDSSSDYDDLAGIINEKVVPVIDKLSSKVKVQLIDVRGTLDSARRHSDELVAVGYSGYGAFEYAGYRWLEGVLEAIERRVSEFNKRFALMKNKLSELSGHKEISAGLFPTDGGYIINDADKEKIKSIKDILNMFIDDGKELIKRYPDSEEFYNKTEQKLEIYWSAKETYDMQEAAEAVLEFYNAIATQIQAGEESKSEIENKIKILQSLDNIINEGVKKMKSLIREDMGALEKAHVDVNLAELEEFLRGLDLRNSKAVVAYIIFLLSSDRLKPYRSSISDFDFEDAEIRYNHIITELKIFDYPAVSSPIGIRLSPYLPDKWRLVRYGNLSEPVKASLYKSAQNSFPNIKLKLPEFSNNDMFVVELNESDGIKRVLGAWIKGMENSISLSNDLEGDSERKMTVRYVLEDYKRGSPFPEPWENYRAHRVLDRIKEEFQEFLNSKEEDGYLDESTVKPILEYYESEASLVKIFAITDMRGISGALKMLCDVLKVKKMFEDEKYWRMMTEAAEKNENYLKIAGSPLGKPLFANGEEAVRYVSLEDLQKTMTDEAILKLVNNTSFPEGVNSGSMRKKLSLQSLDYLKKTRMAITIDSNATLSLLGMVHLSDIGEIVETMGEKEIIDALRSAWKGEKGGRPFYSGSPLMGVRLSQETPDTWRIVRYGNLSEPVKASLYKSAQNSFPDIKLPEFSDNDMFAIELNDSLGIGIVLGARISGMQNIIYVLKRLDSDKKRIITNTLNDLMTGKKSVDSPVVGEELIEGLRFVSYEDIKKDSLKLKSLMKELNNKAFKFIAGGGVGYSTEDAGSLAGMYFAVKLDDDGNIDELKGILHIGNGSIETLAGENEKIIKALEEKSKKIVSSAVEVTQKSGKWGGIDLTDRALHIKLERVGSFASTPLLLPQVKNVQDLDLDKEFEQVEALASSGIVPNSHRLLELFTVCHYRGEFGERLNQIISCLKAASAIQEAQAIDSDEDFRLALMMPEVLS